MQAGYFLVVVALLPFLYYLFLRREEHRYSEVLKTEMEARENDGDCDGVRLIVSTDNGGGDSGGGDNKASSHSPEICSEIAWADLPTVFQRHWTVLGYNRQKWDAGHPNDVLKPVGVRALPLRTLTYADVY